MRPYAGSVQLLDHLEERRTKIAVVTSSRNASAVLEAADLRPRFDVIVDGNVAAENGLKGKPSPDTFVAAAEELGVPVERAVVFEDAVSECRQATPAASAWLSGSTAASGAATDRVWRRPGCC